MRLTIGGLPEGGFTRAHDSILGEHRTERQAGEAESEVGEKRPARESEVARRHVGHRRDPASITGR